MLAKRSARSAGGRETQTATIPFEVLKNEWMKDPAFRAEYERLAPEYELALARIKAETT